MASFTETLNNANSSRRVIDPQNNKGPTFLEGLANLGTNLVSGGSQVYRQAQADGQRQAAAAAKARADGAENAAAGFSLDVMRGRITDQQAAPTPAQPLPEVPVGSVNDYGQPVAIDSELEGAPPPPGVERAVDEITRAKAAEDQGRTPQGTSRITIEARLSDLLAQYPDQQNVILKTFREAGIEHALFRTWETEQKVQDVRRDAELGDFTRAVEAASKAGLYLPNMSPEDAAATGRGLLKYEQDIKVAKDLQAAQQAAAGENRTATEFAQKQYDRTATGAYLGIFDQVTNPLYNSLSSRITEAGLTDDEGNVRSFEQLLSEGVIGIDQITTNLISRATAENAGPEVFSAIRERGEQLKKSLTTMWSGDGSQYQVRQQALTSIKTELGIESAEALPLYTSLSEIMGQGAVNAIFQNNPAAFLPPGTLDAIKKELQGVRGIIDTPQEEATMATIAGVLRGDLNLNQLTERQAVTAIPTLAQTHQANAREVVQGRGNTRAYLNSGTALVNAAVELQPGADYQRFRQVSVAQNYLFQPDQLRADVKLAQDSPEQGELLIAGKRAAAQHTLRLAQDQQLSRTEQQQGWSMAYVNGSYQPQLNRTRYEQWVRETSSANRARAGAMSSGTGMGAERGFTYNPPTTNLPSYDVMRGRVPQVLKDQSWGMNLSLNYLTETASFDDEFKGASKAEVRRFFQTQGQEVPRSMQQRQQQDAAAAASYRQRDAALRGEIQNAVGQSMEASAEAIAERPANELQSQVEQKAAARGLDWSLVSRLVTKESAWKTGARNGTTGASGLFQINDNVNRSIDENIDKGLEMLADAQTGAQRVLGRRPQNWETYVMFQQGPGGGAALLNPANATKKAVDVLIPAYQGNAGLARQAITANGGNLNMTAAEFARSIGNYFNG